MRQWSPAWLQGGISEAYVGAVRVFGIGSKLLFEQVTRLDNQEMVLGWQLITHPGKTCTSACVLCLGEEQACFDAVLTAASCSPRPQGAQALSW